MGAVVGSSPAPRYHVSARNGSSFGRFVTPGMKLDEHSLESIQRVIEGANENRESWLLPARPVDTALRQAELYMDSPLADCRR